MIAQELLLTWAIYQSGFIEEKVFLCWQIYSYFMTNQLSS